MYSINTHTLRWVACWQRVKRILMSLVHAAKHKDKANRSTLPTCSCFKCLLKVNKSWDTNCTCKYLKKHSNRAERMNEGGTMKRGMRSIKIIQSVSNQYSCYILILKGVVKTGDGWEATWRNREFSPELHYDLLTERERLKGKHVLSQIWIWISECLVCYAVLWQQPLFFQVMSWVLGASNHRSTAHSLRRGAAPWQTFRGGLSQKVAKLAVPGLWGYYELHEICTLSKIWHIYMIICINQLFPADTLAVRDK